MSKVRESTEVRCLPFFCHPTPVLNNLATQMSHKGILLSTEPEIVSKSHHYRGEKGRHNRNDKEQNGKEIQLQAKLELLVSVCVCILFSRCLCCYCCFGVIPSNAQGLFLPLHSGIYSWWDSRDYMKHLRSNPSRPCARQVPYPLDYLLASLNLFYSKDFLRLKALHHIPLTFF